MDTNVLLRFLRNDHPDYSRASRKLFEKAGQGKVRLRIPFIAIAETLHVLRTRYKVDRALSAREVMKIINGPGVELSAPAWLEDAIADYGNTSVSFGDACIAAEARAERQVVASFDRDFDSMPGVKRHEP